MEVTTVESKVITDNHNRRLEVDYDGKQFFITRSGASRRVIELDLKEAQSLAYFILWRGLQWR